jgi:hypothetical protein
MEWFATHSAGILRGSLSNADDKIQLLWIKFMAMANEAKDPVSGRLEFSKGQPYDLVYIAAICRKSVDDIKEAIEDFKKDISKDGTPRVTIEIDGTVVLNNWARYQPRERSKVRDNDNGKGELTQLGKEINQASFVKNTLDKAIATAKSVNPQIADEYLDQKCKPTTKELRDMNKALKNNKKGEK